MTIHRLRRRVFGVSSFFLALLVNGLLILSLLPDTLFGGYRLFMAAILALVTQLVLLLRWRPRVTRTMWLATALIVGEAIALLCALYWGGSTDYGVWKYSTFLLMSVLPFIVVLCNYNSRPVELMDFIRCLFFVSLAPLFLPIVMPELQDISTANWLLAINGIDVITVARTCGVGSLIGLALSFRARGFRKYLLLVLSLALGAEQVLIGERGPIIALSVGLLYIIVKHVDNPLRGGRFSIGAVVALCALVCAVPLMISRMPRFAWEEVVNDPRMIILSEGLEAFRSAPFLGLGLGTFSNSFQAIGGRHYAHNLFLELLSESGVFGVVFALCLSILVFNRFRCPVSTSKSADDIGAIISRALAVFTFVAVQFSGDLATNGLVWTSAALVLASTAYNPRSPVKRSQANVYIGKRAGSTLRYGNISCE